MKLGANWSVDASGTPWYSAPSTGRRRRGKWCVCSHCQEDFPSHPGNPGLYCSRSCRGKVCGGTTRATRPDLFEHWTAAECWLAGLIWSDGCLSRVRGPNRRIVLNLTDEQPIAEAAEIAGCRYRSVAKEAPRKAIHVIQFGERQAVRRLADIGMAEPKLTTRPWPDLPHPASFLRGAFDGDGCACRYVQKRAKSHPERILSVLFGGPVFLSGVQQFLSGYGIEPKTIRSRTKKQTIHYVQWQMADSMRLAEVMYSEPGPRMERKWAKFYADPEKMMLDPATAPGG